MGHSRLDVKYRPKSVTASPNFPQVIGVLGEGHQNPELFKMHVTRSWSARGPGGGDDGTDQTVSELEDVRDNSAKLSYAESSC